MKLVPAQIKKGAKILLLGEAPGVDEEAKGAPFVGASGHLLDTLLEASGLRRGDLSITNVFKVRPPGNDVSWFFLGKREAKNLKSPFPRFKGKILKPQFEEMVRETQDEILSSGSDVVIAMGATALWATLKKDKITDYRGSIEPWGDLTVVPTFHPAAVLRDYSLRLPVLIDLDRARRHALSPIKRMERLVHVVETKDDLLKTFDILASCEELTVDVETAERQITCFSLTPSPQETYVIPIWDKRMPGWSKWSLDTEALLMLKTRELFRGKTLIFHNANYDLTYFREWGIVPDMLPHDTMLMHHSMEPEMRKSLGYLVSLRLDEPAWKYMSNRTKEEEKDEE